MRPSLIRKQSFVLEPALGLRSLINVCEAHMYIHVSTSMEMAT
jgi:hypothetical protein